MSESLIFHVDVNSAFLSWESVHRLEESPDALDLRLIPAVIGGSEENRHGIVLAKSTPAKAYKIRTGEPLVDARRKCPNLVVAPSNYGLYVEYSRILMDFLRTYAPVVEQYSIDEAFCDMSGTRKLYGDPVVFAHKLKDEIREKYGFTVNVGISTNRLLAKMASDFEKPDRVHTLFPEEVPEKMWPLSVEELFFVGGNTAKKLHALGIHTIGELAASDVTLIKAHFKKHGEVIWNYANGRDVEIVTDHQVANKGYGNETTIAYDVTDADTAKAILLSLCETVGARLRADHVQVPVVQVMITDSDFRKKSHQVTLPASTNLTEVIYETACQLFDELWDHQPIRLLGVSTSKAAEEEEYEQYDMFQTERNEKLAKLNSAIDSIRARYGNDSVMRARFVGSEQAHMTGKQMKHKDTK